MNGNQKPKLQTINKERFCYLVCRMKSIPSQIRVSSLTMFVLLGAWGCKSPVEAFEGPGIHVLYVGNSLTFVNDLPETVAGIMAMAGQEISYKAITRPDFALIDHLNGGSDAVSEIKRGGWDVVILQQGPSSLPESRDLLIQWTGAFDQIIRSVGARTALYMVWPSKDRFSFFEDVRLSYKLAADTVGGIFLPAGEAWLKAWADSAELPLYGPDDFHPSPLGTFLAALVIYERISGGNAEDLPPQVKVAGNVLDVPEETARLLQRVAHTTNQRYAAE